MARDHNNDKLNYLSHGTSIISATEPRPITISSFFNAAARGVFHWLWNNNKSNNTYDYNSNGRYIYIYIYNI